MTSINKDDYMEDGQGRLVPLDLVKPIDKTRDELVRGLVQGAQELQGAMVKFKKDALTEVKSFVDLSAMEWEVAIGGKKGNIILHTFDGRYKAQVQIAESLVFDEQLQIAKKMIDECLTKWTRKSSSEIKVLINDAFQVDKAGRINAKRILSLRRLDIKDKLWCKAMDAISASLQVVNSKEYFRLYKRAGQNKWRPISLDMAAL